MCIHRSNARYGENAKPDISIIVAFHSHQSPFVVRRSVRKKNGNLTAEHNRKSYPEEARRTITDELIDLACLSAFFQFIGVFPRGSSLGYENQAVINGSPHQRSPKHPVGNGRRRQ